MISHQPYNTPGPEKKSGRGPPRWESKSLCYIYTYIPKHKYTYTNVYEKTYTQIHAHTYQDIHIHKQTY